MLDQDISGYLQALRKREDARKKLREISEVLAKALRQVGELLKNSASGNNQANYMYNFGRFEAASTSKWPSAESVNNAFRELLAATTQADELWNMLPQDRRFGLSSPISPESSLADREDPHNNQSNEG